MSLTINYLFIFLLFLLGVSFVYFCFFNLNFFFYLDENIYLFFLLVSFFSLFIILLLLFFFNLDEN